MPLRRPVCCGAQVLRGANLAQVLRGANLAQVLRGANLAQVLRGANLAQVLRGANLALYDKSLKGVIPRGARPRNGSV